MTELERKIQRLAEIIAESKTQQKRSRSFDKYLREWNIFRLTEQKAKEIDKLFDKYGLLLVKKDTNQKVSAGKINRKDKVIIKYANDKDNTNRTAINPFNLYVNVANGNCPKKPYPFQLEAYKKLDDFYKTNNKKGLLVLPTGAGKTFTSVSWLLRNATNINKKIIWIAHRHELLEQVKDEITKLAYESILPNRKNGKISIQLISGSHDKAININKDTDILIASVQTLNRNLEYLKNKYLKQNNDIFLVIDEAHHATARTYRKLIETVTNTSKNYNILGLTATPFRTDKKEKSYLAKIFNSKPIFSKDLRDLIIDGTLSEPYFIPVKTNINFTKKDFSEKELSLLQSNFDLPEKIKQKIIEQKDRNKLIVEHYLKNKNKYKQTLIFALNQIHAFQLNKLLQENGVKSNFVISGTQSFIGVNTDKDANHKAINDFRENRLETLVNVNILTEGTDLPNTQTVFLTRPTKSKTLMTQMVGRALRGVKSKGTKKAYIVSFIDDWSNLVAWQNPAELYVDEIDFSDKQKDRQKYQVQFISIELINQFSILADKLVNTETLEAYPAIMRIPIGWYSFQLEKRINKDDIDYKSCKVLVFEQHKDAFDEFRNNIEKLYNRFDYDKNKMLNENEKADLLDEIKSRFFDTLEYPEPYISNQDLIDIIDYYDINKEFPVFFSFEEREKFDILKLAKHIFANDLKRSQEREFINKEWEGFEGKSIWKDFYSNNKNYFINDIELEIKKLNHPEIIEKFDIPKIEYVKEKLESLPLHLWPNELYIEIREKVFNKWDKENPNEQIDKKDRWKYQIDHIIPMAKGGKTMLENLQPLLTYKNKIKGDKI